MLRPPYRRSRLALQRIGSKDSARTILIALAANVVIAIAKLITGLISGSTALLAEAAHSLADASNEVFLGISLRRGAVSGRSSSRRPWPRAIPLGVPGSGRLVSDRHVWLHLQRSSDPTVRAVVIEDCAGLI